ncbi:MAG: FAD-binding protein [Coriobacteriia bacterium]|nr:FAD-binding protein [Coriobacteriia bacterium]
MEAKDNAGLSRRDFLRGAALGSAAVVGANMLGGCAPAPATVPSPTFPDTGKTTDPGVYPFETPPTPIPESAIVQTIATDVLVVGFGSAGITAALSAAETGAHVAVMQKAGTFFAQGSWIGGLGSKLQIAKGYNPDILPILIELQNASANKADFGLIKLWGYNSGKVIDWMTAYSDAAKLPVEWAGDVQMADPLNRQYPTLHVWQGWLQALMKVLVDNCLKKNVDIHYNMPALQLIQKDGRVVGAIGKNADGKYVRISAAKGVVLATGDYGNDTDMVAKYCPAVAGAANYYRPAYNTGDGQKMAMWVGAKVMQWQHAPMLGYTAVDQSSGDFPFSGSPWLTVNTRGERYCNEDSAYHAAFHADLRQPAQTKFQICDSTWPTQWSAFGKSWTRLPILPGELLSTSQAAAADVWSTGIKRGAVIQGATLEELAGKISVPGKTLAATVARYNELVKAGRDDDFGKNPAYLKASAIAQAPFYAIPRHPGLLTVPGGGVWVNTKLQVLDKNDAPIPGLYAAGNTAGGFYGNDYTQLIPGGSLGRATTFGYLAGKAAAE